MGASQMQIIRESISQKGSSDTKDVMVLTLGGNTGSLLYVFEVCSVHGSWEQKW